MGKPRIAIRIDDVCPWSDAGAIKRVVDKAESHGVTGLLGVVPSCEDPYLMVGEQIPDFWRWLRVLRDKGWTIALHGYRHVYAGDALGLMSTAPKKTEFAGKPYDVQLNAISSGKAILLAHGIDVDVFFAPSHSYDYNTLRALRATGFIYVSDGRSRRSYVREGLKHVPCRHYGLPKRPAGMVTLAMHPCEPKPLEPWLEYIDRWSDCLVSWSDLASEPVRGNVTQILDERLYLFKEESVKPPLRVVRDVIMRKRVI